MRAAPTAAGVVTQRRPAHEAVPDFVERQIVEAQARGDFDGLRGAGQPLPDLDRPHDELWWVRRKLRDEHVTDLPPALRVRRDRDRVVAAALDADSEAAARRLLERLNDAIREVNRTTWHGPPTSVGVVDVDEVLAAWRSGRPGRDRTPASEGRPSRPPSPDGPDGPDGPRRGLVRRLVARARRRRTRRRGR